MNRRLFAAAILGLLLTSPTITPAQNRPAKDSSRENGATSSPSGEDIPVRGSPLETISRRIETVRDRLQNRDSSAATQSEQQRIVDELSQLIDQANAQRQPPPSKNERQPPKPQQARANSSKNQRDPADSKTTPSNTPGDVSPSRNATQDVKGKIDPVATDALIKQVWGHLPPRVREQIRTPVADEFLPKYERIIADYYRRLAEEQR